MPIRLNTIPSFPRFWPAQLVVEAACDYCGWPVQGAEAMLWFRKGEPVSPSSLKLCHGGECHQQMREQLGRTGWASCYVSEFLDQLVCSLGFEPIRAPRRSRAARASGPAAAGAGASSGARR